MEYTIYLVQSIASMTIMGYTYKKCKHDLSGLTLALIISWSVEALMELILAIMALAGEIPKNELATHSINPGANILYMIWYALSELNFLGFLAFLFRLKAVDCYFNPLNLTVDNIANQLESASKIRIVYLFYYCIIVISQMMITFSFASDMVTSSAYGWFNLRFNVISLCIMAYVHSIFLKSAIQKQGVFRAMGYVGKTDKSPEMIIIGGYSIYCGYLLYWYIMMPLTVLLVSGD
jgi:hypothetical protein